MAKLVIYGTIISVSVIFVIISWSLRSGLGLTVSRRKYVGSSRTQDEPIFQNANALQQASVNYLCLRTGARMGNNMFAYASALGLAHSKGMILVASTGIREVFKLGSHCEEQIELWGRFCETAKKIYENSLTCNAFDKNIWDLDASQHTRIIGCLRSWRYLVGHETAIRNAFTFRDHVHTAALEALRREIAKQGKEGCTSNGGVLVGVHVRRGDKVNDKAFIVPPKEYFQRAMTFMRQKFKSVTFVVCSDDLTWSRKNLFSTDTIFIETGRADLDFRILSLCNHTIMSLGTFGWWAAWLANGTTIYYQHSFRKGLGADKHTNMTEYMPIHWIAMT